MKLPKPTLLETLREKLPLKTMDFSGVTLDQMRELVFVNLEEFSGFHIVAETDSFDQLPKEWLTCENLIDLTNELEISPLHWAAKFGFTTFPRNLLSKETLKIKGRRDCSVMHVLVENKNLGKIPQEYICAETLLTVGHGGLTPLHAAAYSNSWEHIPNSVLTEENLHLPTADDRSILHMVFSSEGFDLETFPAKLYSPKNMTMVDIEQVTPFHVAAQNGYLRKLPLSLSNPVNLTLQSVKGTPLDMAIRAKRLADVPGYAINEILCASPSRNQELFQLLKNNVTAGNLAAAEDTIAQLLHERLPLAGWQSL